MGQLLLELGQARDRALHPAVLEDCRRPGGEGAEQAKVARVVGASIEVTADHQAADHSRLAAQQRDHRLVDPSAVEHLRAGIIGRAGAHDHAGGLGFEHVVELAERERHHHLIGPAVAHRGAERLLGGLRREHGQLRDLRVEDRPRAVEEQQDRGLELPAGQRVDGADEELGRLVVIPLANPGAVGQEHRQRDHCERNQRERVEGIRRTAISPMHIDARGGDEGGPQVVGDIDPGTPLTRTQHDTLRKPPPQDDDCRGRDRRHRAVPRRRAGMPGDRAERQDSDRREYREANDVERGLPDGKWSPGGGGESRARRVRDQQRRVASRGRARPQTVLRPA